MERAPVSGLGEFLLFDRLAVRATQTTRFDTLRLSKGGYAMAQEWDARQHLARIDQLNAGFGFQR